MEWKVFDSNCPKDVKMIFREDNGNWFEGTLIDDSEYGLVISLWESYISIKGVTHYLIPDL